MISAVSDTLRDFGTMAALVLSFTAFGIAAAAFVRISNLTPRVDEIDDRTTPSFDDAFAEADTDPSPAPLVATAQRVGQRTDTEENDMPRQVEEAKLEAERAPAVETEMREMLRSDGSTRSFQFRKSDQ